jgi:hypothetical protein
MAQDGLIRHHCAHCHWVTRSAKRDNVKCQNCHMTITTAPALDEIVLKVAASHIASGDGGALFGAQQSVSS